MATRALCHPLDALPEQRSWTEVGFGAGAGEARNDLPWDPVRAVEIPGADGVSIRGYIDRLDLSARGDRARVIDYKSGRLNSKMSDVAVDGGRELQRCLYAFAVKTLLRGSVAIEAALLYPSAEDGEQALFPLSDVDGALASLAKAIAESRAAIEEGNALPGIDAGDDYNDLAFAFPTAAGYLGRKTPLFEAALGHAAEIWKAP